LLLHFLDLHFLAERGRSNQHVQIQYEADLAVRLSLIAADKVFLPAASYFESPLCRRVIDTYPSFFDLGQIWLAGRGSSAEEFIESKFPQYPVGTPQRDRYEEARGLPELLIPYHTKTISSTDDLVAGWHDLMEAPGFPDSVLGRGLHLPRNFEAIWQRIPDLLDGRAFIADNVEPLLFPQQGVLTIRNRLHGVINTGYFEGYAQELDAGLVVDLVLLHSPRAFRTGNLDLPFRRFRELLRSGEVLASIIRTPPEELLNWRSDERVQRALNEAIVEDQSDLPALVTRLFDTSTDLTKLVERATRIRPGSRDAHLYHRAVEDAVTAIFRYSLTDLVHEHEIHEGRKRIDFTMRNFARYGFFRGFPAHEWKGELVICECKNYSNDVKNEEIDQLRGRFAPHRGTLGILFCRHIRNRSLFEARCRDVVEDRAGWIIGVDDSDLTQLAVAGADPRWLQPQSRYLWELFRRCAGMDRTPGWL